MPEEHPNLSPGAGRCRASWRPLLGQVCDRDERGAKSDWRRLPLKDKEAMVKAEIDDQGASAMAFEQLVEPR